MFTKHIKKIFRKKNYLNVTEIAAQLNLTAYDTNKIFEELKWAEKKDKWWVATPLGLKNGAKQEYNFQKRQKYIRWNSEVVHSKEFLQKVQKLQHTKNMIIKAQNKEKGSMYENYVANFFRIKGYYVWEHGKEKGVEDSSIDLLIKKGEAVYFVQCTNWDKWKIDHKEVKATQKDIENYLDRKKDFSVLLENYQCKIMYVTPKPCLTKGAYKYVQENNHIVEHQIIRMGEHY